MHHSYGTCGWCRLRSPATRLLFISLFRLAWNTASKLCITLTHPRIYTSVKMDSIGSDIGLSPNRRQAITGTNADLLSIRPLGRNVSEIWIEIQKFSFTKITFFIQENVFENVVCEWRLFFFFFFIKYTWAEADRPQARCIWKKNSRSSWQTSLGQGSMSRYSGQILICIKKNLNSNALCGHDILWAINMFHT